MSTRRATRLAAVKDAPEPRRFTIDPARAYPDNAHNQSAYEAAVAWMRSRSPSLFTLDEGARRPGWHFELPPHNERKESPL